MKRFFTIALISAIALSATIMTSCRKGEKVLDGTWKKLGIEVVSIPSGTFQMGSPNDEPDHYSDETQHWVKLTQRFYMSKYEITNAQYAAFLNAKSVSGEVDGDYFVGKCDWGSNAGAIMIYDSRFESSYNWGINWNSDASKWVSVEGKDNHPVIWITWYGAYEYAVWAGGSLPTSAQWEYACRGGQSESLPFGIGTGRKLTGDMANFDARSSYNLDAETPGSYNADGEELHNITTVPVGSYPYKNGYGLYDMHGNVYEWCLDSWDGTNNYETATESNPQIDPVGKDGSYRIRRGGGWYEPAKNCRSAFRVPMEPSVADRCLGFRVVFLK